MQNRSIKCMVIISDGNSEHVAPSLGKMGLCGEKKGPCVYLSACRIFLLVLFVYLSFSLFVHLCICIFVSFHIINSHKSKDIIIITLSKIIKRRYWYLIDQTPDIRSTTWCFYSPDSICQGTASPAYPQGLVPCILPLISPLLSGSWFIFIIYIKKFKK